MENSSLGKKLTLLICGLLMIVASIFCYFMNYYSLTIYVLDILGLGMILLSCFDFKYSQHKFTVKEIALIGVQGALASLLYIFVKFPLPIFPSFLDLQVSEIPALITSFMYGPYAGAMVILIRFIIKLPFSGTAGVGEIADLIIGLVVVIISGIIYGKKHTFKGAVVGMSTSMVTGTVLACLANWLILIPFYLQLYFNGSMAPLVGMCQMIPGINETNFMPLYIFVGVLPFNLLRFRIVFVLTILLYKRISFLFTKITK